MSSISRQQLIIYLNDINVDGQDVLDIGSGNKSPYQVTKWVKGTPKSYETMDIDTQVDPSLVGDLNSPNITEMEFDYVFCLEVLEHCWNPVVALINILSMAKKKAYISTPFINPIHDNWDYLRYTDEWFIEVISRINPKAKVKVYTRDATEGYSSLMDFYREEGLRMSKIRLKKGEGDKLGIIGYFIEVDLE